jgi:antitoxin PrlF
MSERDLVGVITQKGQVTIPVEIRRLLGIGPRDRVIFSVEAGQVRLKAETETLESVYGAVKPLHQPEDFQALRDQAIEEHAYQAIKEQDTRYAIP